jgi:DmsE family decaheme c-type cytochrome
MKATLEAVGVLSRVTLLITALLVGYIGSVIAEDNEDMVHKGNAVCTRCHDEMDVPPVLDIGKTRHGTVADGRTPTCTSCHGDSESHINKPKGKSERPQVDVYFSSLSSTPVAQQNQSCLNCHQGDARTHWATDTHNANGVSCVSCHDIHSQHDKVRDKREQAEVCFTCHKEQRMQYRRVSRHPTVEGKVVCSDCHNTHGSAGPRQLKKASVVETCYECHAEKRGPFLWPHEPVQEDCTHCHNPHGSNVSSLLKWRPPFLCQECHGADTSHRGRIQSQNGSSTGDASGRSCLNCHTNIHGGNNPEDTSGSRSFRH